MKRISLILSIIFATTISCKQEEVKKEIVEEKPFTIEMEVKIKEDDVICIYFKDNTIGFFNEDMAIYKPLVKSDSTQNLIFELPEGIIPNDFRFDLSHKNPNQTMLVNKITFINNGKSFVIENKDIDKYFAPNSGVVFNESDRSFTFKKNDDGNYDPFLSSTGQFYPLLETLVGSKVFTEEVK